MDTGITKLLALVIIAWPLAAEAHVGQVKRTLMLEAAVDHLEVLLEVEVSGKERLRALWALADVDRDGQISQREEDAISLELATRGLDGLQLRVGTTTVSLAGVETKIRLEPERPVLVLLHGRAPLPVKVDRIWVETGRFGDPLGLRILPSKPALTCARARKKAGGIMEVGLGLGDKVELRVGPGE